eukprot:gene5715-biopygen7896
MDAFAVSHGGSIALLQPAPNCRGWDPDPLDWKGDLSVVDIQSVNQLLGCTIIRNGPLERIYPQKPFFLKGKWLGLDEGQEAGCPWAGAAVVAPDGSHLQIATPGNTLDANLTAWQVVLLLQGCREGDTAIFYDQEPSACLLAQAAQALPQWNSAALYGQFGTKVARLFAGLMKTRRVRPAARPGTPDLAVKRHRGRKADHHATGSPHMECGNRVPPGAPVRPGGTAMFGPPIMLLRAAGRGWRPKAFQRERMDPLKVKRPSLRRLRLRLRDVLVRVGLDIETAERLGFHPLVLKELIVGRVPSLWAEAVDTLLRDKGRSKMLWLGVDLCIARFIEDTRACPQERARNRALDQIHRQMGRILDATAPPGARIPRWGPQPWTARGEAIQSRKWTLRST